MQVFPAATRIWMMPGMAALYLSTTALPDGSGMTW